MNETLLHEPAYEPMADTLCMEFSAQVPEYVNPDWDDDALYDLICMYQDVLVRVDNITMTLSAAMNQHPGPWTPENEPNLIAYAEGLLAGAVLEPLMPEQHTPDDPMNESLVTEPRFEEVPIQDVIEKVQVKNASEPLETRKLRPVQSLPEVPVVRSEPTPALAEVRTRPEPSAATISIKRSEQASPIDDQPGKMLPQDRAIAIESVVETPRPIDDQPEAVEPDRQEPSLLAEEAPIGIEMIAEEIVIENDSAIEATEPLNELCADETQAPLITEYGPEYAFEEPYIAAEIESAEIPREPVSEDPIPHQTDTMKQDELEPVAIVSVADVEDALTQLVELIESEAVDGDEGTDRIVTAIIEAPITLKIETKEEWRLLYVELFEAAGIPYTPELVESLADLSINWNLLDEIERLNEAEYDVSTSEGGSVRMLVSKLLVAITSIIQAIRHVFAIGTYVLRLSLVPTADFR